jgi:hypothetical protein
MAIKYKFTCSEDDSDFMTIESYKEKEKNSRCYRENESQIKIYCSHSDGDVAYIFDVQTAIKFAKTLRTEINKAKEVCNG